jgi:hypothetical protein
LVLLSTVRIVGINIQSVEEKSLIGIGTVIGGEEETSDYSLCKGTAPGSTSTHNPLTSSPAVNRGLLPYNCEAYLRFHRIRMHHSINPVMVLF